MIINRLLLIPGKLDSERELLARTWIQLGGQIKRIDKFWIKPDTGNKKIALYGNETFCLVLSEVLGKKLVTVKDDIIVDLDRVWTKRQLEVKTIGECFQSVFPKFVKSVAPKVIKARVYQTLDDFLSGIGKYDPNEKVIVSDIIDIKAEVRVFVLDNTVSDLAYYEGQGNIEDAKDFASNFLENCEVPLPKTFVMDLGLNERNEWFIVEFNSTWGSGLNGCDPNKVVNCIMQATKE